MKFSELKDGVATVVIVGTWNPGIFTPDFVKENIITEESFQLYYPKLPMMSLMYLVPGKFRFQLNGNRLEFCLLNNDDNASKELLQIIRSILRCLVYTPVNSVGINYLFETEEAGDQLFNIGHTSQLKQSVNGELVGIELARSFKFDEKCQLNFKVSQAATHTRFDFNYSYQENNCQSILNLFEDDDTINDYRKRSIDILQSVYNND